ncbi:hypothetical protein BGLA2_140016 [Burkholderia gladioli]|nr:hypothetical protein BGLA2_140016 [Burkholderia gladioli]
MLRDDLLGDVNLNRVRSLFAGRSPIPEPRTDTATLHFLDVFCRDFGDLGVAQSDAAERLKCRKKGVHFAFDCHGPLRRARTRYATASGPLAVCPPHLVHRPNALQFHAQRPLNELHQLVASIRECLAVVAVHKVVRRLKRQPFSVASLGQLPVEFSKCGRHINLLVPIVRQDRADICKLRIDLAIIRLAPFAGRRNQLVTLRGHQLVEPLIRRLKIPRTRLQAFARIRKTCNVPPCGMQCVRRVIDAFDRDVPCSLKLSRASQHALRSFNRPISKRHINLSIMVWYVVSHPT